MLIKGFDHIALAVPSAAEAETFFRDVLELPVEPGNRGVYVRLGNAYMWVFESDAGRPSSDGRTTDWRNNPPGIDHFALSVDDIDEAGAALEAKGVVFPGPVVDGASGIRFRGFIGPGAVVMYLLQAAPSKG